MGTKQAIAVQGPAETGQDFVCGMPAGEPKTKFSAPQLVESIKRRIPIQDKTEYGAGVPLGMEATQQTMLERLSMKWANDPFTAGFAQAVQAGLEKDAGLMSWAAGLMGGAAKATAAAPKPAPQLQAALKSRLTPKAIAPSGMATRIEAPKPTTATAEADPWGSGGGHSENRLLRRLDAHAARTRPGAAAAPRPEWKPFYPQKG